MLGGFVGHERADFQLFLHSEDVVVMNGTISNLRGRGGLEMTNF